MKTFVLYHAHCADGFGAAFAAWCALGDEGVSYLPISYGDPWPDIPDGSTVYIVDFSAPNAATGRAELIALAARCTVQVIDHHKTAAATLAGLEFARFDMDKSGAVLTWEHFQGQGNCFGLVPELLLYVQDRDLWRWELPDSREVSAALALVPKNFEAWEHLSVGRLRGEGAIALRVQQALVKSICARYRYGTVGGRLVPLVNTPVLISECCEELLRQEYGCGFVAAYFDGEYAVHTVASTPAMISRKWSLRSGPDFDVSAVAKTLGGGGHAQAAGFEQLLRAYDP